MRSDIYIIHKISVLEWQLAVNKVWHFQINFYRFLSPEERTRAWWVKPVLSVLWNDGEVGHELAVLRMAGKAGAAACCLWEKPFLGSNLLWGVLTQCWVNNTGFICCHVMFSADRGAAKQEQMVCAWAWPWSYEYLCDQHIKSHFNRYHFDGFNKLI